MDLHTVLKEGVTFGPFKTDHHRTIVNADFQAAFLRHLAEVIVPNLTIGTDSVQGTVSTRYDEERFLGPISAVKYRYSFNATFRHGNRRERVDFGLRFGDPASVTARDYERAEEERRASLERLDREADAFLEPGGSVEDHWAACARVWSRCAQVLESSVGPFGGRPVEHQLCERFVKRHPASERFLLGKLQDPDPLLAAYAFKCWILLDEPKKASLPEMVLARTEPIRIHSGCFVVTSALGRWIAEFRKEET